MMQLALFSFIIQPIVTDPMDKYSDLPDIDGSSRDVYETSDVESDSDAPLDNDLNPDIDNTKSDTNAARSRFHRDVISDEIEFLGDIRNRRLQGYAVVRVDETREEKLARIRRELEELKQTDGQETGGQAKELDDLLVVLESLKNDTGPTGYYEKRIDDIFKMDLISARKGPDSVKEESTKPASVKEGPEGSKKSDSLPEAPRKPGDTPGKLIGGLEVLLLESRVHSLESVLGYDTVDRGSAPRSIQNQINDLTRKINIIYNPEFEIGAINQQIRELNREAEKLATNRKLAQIASAGNQHIATTNSTSLETKVSTLYEKLPEFEAVNVKVPFIINRLKSLHKIHADLGRTIDTVGGIDQTIEELKTDMVSWNRSLQKVNTNLDEQNGLFERNKEEVEKRIAEMSQKLGQ